MTCAHKDWKNSSLITHYRQESLKPKNANSNAIQTDGRNTLPHGSMRRAKRLNTITDSKNASMAKNTP